jgi:hypothetical protein
MLSIFANTACIKPICCCGLTAGSIDIMSTPEDVAEQQRRLKPGVVVAQHLFNRVRTDQELQMHMVTAVPSGHQFIIHLSIIWLLSGSVHFGSL